MLMSHGGFARLLARGCVTEARAIWRVSHKGALRSAQGSDVKAKRTESLQLLKSVWGQGAILLAGCGTDEAVLYGRLHPESKIDGVDLSRHSLIRARLKIWLSWALRPRVAWTHWRATQSCIRLYCGDVEAMLSSQLSDSRYDLVVCYGVLHHQNNPKRFLHSLMHAMKDDGCLRMMIYTSTGRNLERSGQRLLTSAGRLSGLQLLMKSLRLQFWLWLSRLSRQSPSSYRFKYLRGTGRAGVADALLHPCDPGLDPALLGVWLEELGCKVLYCAAKSETLGWLIGIESPEETWRTILEEESRSCLVSNIEIIVSAPMVS